MYTVKKTCWQVPIVHGGLKVPFGVTVYVEIYMMLHTNFTTSIATVLSYTTNIDSPFKTSD